jgi:hypothetical protein
MTECLSPSWARRPNFSGGCALDAVEAVSDAEGDLFVDVLEGLS